MKRTMFTGKIHRATITQADLDYEGSVTIDDTLLDASGILEHEMVHIWNVTRGTRLQTYALRGPADSGVICINGAAAHGNEPGDLVIIAAFAEMDDAEARAYSPKVVRVDRVNRIIGTEPEIPGPKMPARVAV
ncbi:MAG: aspartate 1-decarboxylase [Myxococcota bacterium]